MHYFCSTSNTSLLAWANFQRCKVKFVNTQKFVLAHFDFRYSIKVKNNVKLAHSIYIANMHHLLLASNYPLYNLVRPRRNLKAKNHSLAIEPSGELVLTSRAKLGCPKRKCIIPKHSKAISYLPYMLQPVEGGTRSNPSVPAL